LTFRRRAEEELIRQATTDTLTGLPNRALFQKLLGSGIERNRRYDRRLSLLFIDLDGFKEVNDQKGHDVGDLVLKEAAVRLRRAVRVSDEVARLGGDEFTVILSEVTQADDAETVAAKVVDALSRPYEVAGEVLDLSASVGIATCPRDGIDGDQLLHAADEAMYRAKHAGKNRYAFADLKV
jgi:diguanylate cyclase (GGDEF)-like protein